MKPSFSEGEMLDFYQESLSQSNHRFLSWEHCYKHFSNLLAHDISAFNDEIIDLAALNLGFYLASWGMYRGSTFSLQHDYKIHQDCVRLLLNEDYKILYNMTVLDYEQNPSKIKLLFKLRKDIVGLYKKFSQEKTVTDTFVTKILLGTLGCIPAYDRLFREGLKRVEQRQYLNEGSFCELIQYLSLNTDYKILEKVTQQRDISYPPMKLIDMYYWLLGARNKDKEFLIK